MTGEPAPKNLLAFLIRNLAAFSVHGKISTTSFRHRQQHRYYINDKSNPLHPKYLSIADERYYIDTNKKFSCMRKIDVFLIARKLFFKYVFQNLRFHNIVQHERCTIGEINMPGIFGMLYNFVYCNNCVTNGGCFSSMKFLCIIHPCLF